MTTAAGSPLLWVGYLLKRVQAALRAAMDEHCVH